MKMESPTNQNQTEEKSLNIIREVSFLFEKIMQRIQNYTGKSNIKSKEVSDQNEPYKN